jgi:hypothetical protein
MTINTKPSTQLLSLIEAKYTATTLQRCHVGWFLRAARENTDATIVELILDRVSGDDILTTSSFDRTLTSMKGIAQLNGVSAEEASAIREGVALAMPFREGKVGAKPRDAVLENKSDIKTYIESLETTAQKVLAYLSVTTGVKSSCLLRDKYKLQRVHEGVLEVLPRTTAAQAQGRVIKFDPTYINEELDPFGEHVQLLANTFYTADNVGIVSGDVVGSVLTGTPLTFSQLRASYAIHRRKEGANWQELSEELGVSANNVKGVVKRYAEANHIDID